MVIVTLFHTVPDAGSASKGAWKLDASLDEVIESEAASESGSPSGKGCTRRKTYRATFWDAELGWSAGPPRPLPPRVCADSSCWGGKGDGYCNGKGKRKDMGAGCGYSNYDDCQDWQESPTFDGVSEGNSSSSWATGNARSSNSRDWSSSNWTQAGIAGGSGRRSSGSICTRDTALNFWQVNTSRKANACGTEGSSSGRQRLHPEPAPPAPLIDYGRRQGPAHGAQKHRLEDDIADMAPLNTWKRIKVTNIPSAVPPRDLRDAFEAAAGKVIDCKMDRGIAIITFGNPKDAVTAANTFNRGLLNGSVIDVKVVA